MLNVVVLFHMRCIWKCQFRTFNLQLINLVKCLVYSFIVLIENGECKSTRHAAMNGLALKRQLRQLISNYDSISFYAAKSF